MATGHAVSCQASRLTQIGKGARHTYVVGRSGVPVRPKNHTESACCFNMSGLGSKDAELVGEGNKCEEETAQV